MKKKVPSRKKSSAPTSATSASNGANSRDVISLSLAVTLGLALAGTSWRISSQLTGVSKDIAHVSSGLSAVNGRLDSMQADFKTLDGRLTTLTVKVERLDQRMNDWEKDGKRGANR